MLTAKTYKGLLTRAKNLPEWRAHLNFILPQYGIDTSKRLAAFFAQCGHESAGFSALVENLNYSAQGLANTWPNRYAERGTNGGYIRKSGKLVPNSLALRIARNPELIANYTYANRMGNGSPDSGDGWKYRGRGIIQVTGKENYRICSRALFHDLTLIDNPEYLSDIEYAIYSACWYWDSRNLNAYADREDLLGMTKAINGGTNGLAERKHEYYRMIELIENDTNFTGFETEEDSYSDEAV